MVLPLIRQAESFWSNFFDVDAFFKERIFFKERGRKPPALFDPPIFKKKRTFSRSETEYNYFAACAYSSAKSLKKSGNFTVEQCECMVE